MNYGAVRKFCPIFFLSTLLVPTTKTLIEEDLEVRVV